MKKNLVIISIFLTFILSGCVSTPDVKPDGTNIPEDLDYTILPSGTDGSCGTAGSYVLFGKYPQSIKDDDVILSTETENINGWDCYKGSDGFYYVKAMATPYYDDFREYNYVFNNGMTIERGLEYYFKLEPIKWRVVTDDYQGGTLLVAEDVLVNNCFYLKQDNYGRKVNETNINLNNYKYSSIRAFLNGLDGRSYKADDFTGKGFINKAFTEKEIEYIKTVTVDNSPESTTDSGNNIKKADFYEDYTCENTSDKIFLLSENEITKSEYGFDLYNKEDNARKRYTTDFARNFGAYSGYKNISWYWIRSPRYEDDEGARYIDFSGSASHTENVKNSGGGVVPALVVSF